MNHHGIGSRRVWFLVRNILLSSPSEYWNSVLIVYMTRPLPRLLSFCSRTTIFGDMSPMASKCCSSLSSSFQVIFSFFCSPPVSDFISFGPWVFFLMQRLRVQYPAMYHIWCQSQTHHRESLLVIGIVSLPHVSYVITGTLVHRINKPDFVTPSSTAPYRDSMLNVN